MSITSNSYGERTEILNSVFDIRNTRVPTCLPALCSFALCSKTFDSRVSSPTSPHRTPRAPAHLWFQRAREAGLASPHPTAFFSEISVQGGVSGGIMATVGGPPVGMPKAVATEEALVAKERARVAAEADLGGAESVSETVGQVFAGYQSSLDVSSLDAMPVVSVSPHPSPLIWRCLYLYFKTRHPQPCVAHPLATLPPHFTNCTARHRTSRGHRRGRESVVHPITTRDVPAVRRRGRRHRGERQAQQGRAWQTLGVSVTGCRLTPETKGQNASQ